MEAHPALLEAIQKQLDLQSRRVDEQGAAIMKLMEKMSATSSVTNTLAIKDKHAIFDSLYRRIEKFTYDPDRNHSFDIWFKRYKDLFDNECDDIDEKDKVRLLVSRLDEDCHRMLTAAISPKQPSELSWSDRFWDY